MIAARWPAPRAQDLADGPPNGDPAAPLATGSNNGVNRETSTSAIIFENCASKWKTDYEMQVYCRKRGSFGFSIIERMRRNGGC
jgi:hypothetical protein